LSIVQDAGISRNGTRTQKQKTAQQELGGITGGFNKTANHMLPKEYNFALFFALLYCVIDPKTSI
jgi:hypothetical protein